MQFISRTWYRIPTLVEIERVRYLQCCSAFAALALFFVWSGCMSMHIFERWGKGIRRLSIALLYIAFKLLPIFVFFIFHIVQNSSQSTYIHWKNNDEYISKVKNRYHCVYVKWDLFCYMRVAAFYVQMGMVKTLNNFQWHLENSQKSWNDFLLREKCMKACKRIFCFLQNFALICNRQTRIPMIVGQKEIELFLSFVNK